MTQAYSLMEGVEHVDFALVHRWLASSYWTPGIARERVERAARHSALVLSARNADGEQVGFLRVVSDKTRFAYLCDVWVAEAHRGGGVARKMVAHAMAHEDFATVSTWTLGTQDAQPLYARLGFRDVKEAGAYPYTWMVRRMESP